MDAADEGNEVLRASVLEAAVELGVYNETVARWLFEPESPHDISAGNPKPSELTEYTHQATYPASCPWPSSPRESPFCLHQLPLDSASDSSHTSHSHYYHSGSSSLTSHFLPVSPPQELQLSSAHATNILSFPKAWMHSHGPNTPISYASLEQFFNPDDILDDPFHSTLTNAARTPSTPPPLVVSGSPRKRPQGKLKKTRPATRDGGESRSYGYLSEGNGKQMTTRESPKAGFISHEDTQQQKPPFLWDTRQRTQSETQTAPKPSLFLNSPSAESPYFYSSKMPARIPAPSTKSAISVSSPLYLTSSSTTKHAISPPFSSQTNTPPVTQESRPLPQNAKKTSSTRSKILRWGFKRSQSHPDLGSSRLHTGDYTPNIETPPLPAFNVIPKETTLYNTPKSAPLGRMTEPEEYDGSVEASSQSHETSSSTHSDLSKEWQAYPGGFDRDGSFRAASSLRSVDTWTSDATVKPTPSRPYAEKVELKYTSRRRSKSVADSPLQNTFDGEMLYRTAMGGELSSSESLLTKRSDLGLHSSPVQIISSSSDTNALRSYSRPAASFEPQVIASFGPSKSSHSKTVNTYNDIVQTRSQSLTRHQRNPRVAAPANNDGPWEISGSSDFALPSVLTSSPSPSKDDFTMTATTADAQDRKVASMLPAPTLHTPVNASISLRRRAPEALDFSSLPHPADGALTRRPSEPAPSSPIPPRITNRPKSFSSLSSSADSERHIILQPPSALRDVSAIPPPSPPPSAPLPLPPTRKLEYANQGESGPIAPSLTRSRSDSPLNSVRGHDGYQRPRQRQASQMTYLTPPRTPGTQPESRTLVSDGTSRETRDANKTAKYRDLAIALGSSHAPMLSTGTPPSGGSDVSIPDYYYSGDFCQQENNERTSNSTHESIVQSRLSAASELAVGLRELSSLDHPATTLNAPLLRGAMPDEKLSTPTYQRFRIPGERLNFSVGQLTWSKSESHATSGVLHDCDFSDGQSTVRSKTCRTGNTDLSSISFLDLDTQHGDGQSRQPTNGPTGEADTRQLISDRSSPDPLWRKLPSKPSFTGRLPRTPPAVVPIQPPRSAMAAGDVFPRDARVRHAPTTQGWL